MGVRDNLRKYAAASLFLVAGLYLLAAKPPDEVSILAAAACLAAAGLSATRHSDWAIAGGSILVAGSLLLQSAYSYRCSDCLLSDLIILAGVVLLPVAEKGKARVLIRSVVTLLVLVTAGNVFFHHRPGGLPPAGLTAVKMDPEFDPARIPIAGAPGKADRPAPEQPGGEREERSGEAPERYVAAIDGEGRKVILDTAERPVLFFSPTCPACLRAVEALARSDPEGRRWAPVQSYGDPARGRETLRAKGYRGDSYLCSAGWGGSVPALVAFSGKGLISASIPEDMLKIVRSEADARD